MRVVLLKEVLHFLSHVIEILTVQHAPRELVKHAYCTCVIVLGVEVKQRSMVGAHEGHTITGGSRAYAYELTLPIKHVVHFLDCQVQLVHDTNR